ncbi:class I SAM-dependent methyltransferase [Flavobacteriaceae bacterium]|nr:class I SAM-dependent methyltransferase [Flavobacteriaceae bacterium]
MSGDYYKTKDSVAEYIHLAKDVNGAGLIKKLNTYLSKQSSLLEIGSGPGSDFNILSKQYQVTGSDNSEEFLQHLDVKFSNNQFLNLDAATLDTKKKFDAIYSNKVLHHLTDTDLKNSINRQSDILEAGGIICHSFWKGEGSEVFKGLFVNYHSKQAIKSIFQEKFNILLLELYAEFEEADSILLIAKKRA